MAEDNYLLVAAIDFGTTYSGYAFSTRHDFNTDPMKMSLVQWPAGSGGLVSSKTSTCVLFKPDRTFHSFGYTAEDKYLDLAMDDEHEDWYLFRRFKMKLYNSKLDRNFRLKDFNGKKTMPAIKVISAVVCYFKNEITKKRKEQGVDVKDSEIRWVLTVPAIWSDSAKQLMRQAAEMAGLATEQLVICLEPEAASLLCKYVPVERLEIGDHNKFDVFQSGSKYMVLDAGGGSIDITVHEVQRNGQLKEVHCANGGDWGGTKVDEEFEKLLEDLLGKQTFAEFKNNHISDLLEILRSFEVKKKTINGDLSSKLTFSLPNSIYSVISKMNQGKGSMAHTACNPKYSSHVQTRGDKLRLSGTITTELFEKSLKHIIDHISELLREPRVRDITTILMVGGYSECPLLQEAVKRVAGNIRLIVPNEAGLSVLKGAVISGHCPGIISERICKYTYGVKSRSLFIEGKHREDYRVINEKGEGRCDNAFGRYVKKGETVKVGSTTPQRGYTVSCKDQTAMSFPIYASTDEDPLYVTDKSCQKIGEVKIPMPDTSRGLERGADVSMCFGGSEIEVKVVEKHTGHSVRGFCDFLG